MKKKWMMFAAAAMFTMTAAVPAYAGTWRQDATGWWYENEDGSYLVNRWEWLDENRDGVAESYYFGSNGYLLTNTITPDGFQVNENGAWTVNGAVQTQAAVPDEVVVEVPDVVPAGERQLGVPERVVVDENGTTISYFNGVPYYTYAKDEEPEEPETSGITYEDVDEEELAYRIIELINEERVKAGKSELAVNEELMENARVRAEEACEKFSHTRPDGTRFDTAITVDHTIAGENLVLGIQSPLDPTIKEISEGAASDWMNSPKHKSNLMDYRWDETAVGIYRDGQFFYIIQIFIQN